MEAGGKKAPAEAAKSFRIKIKGDQPVRPTEFKTTASDGFALIVLERVEVK